MNLYFDELATPVAPVLIAVDARGAVKRLTFLRAGERAALPPGARFDAERCAPALRQVAQYFAGERTRFELELDGDGTPFQKRVWRALCDVPFGATATYGAIARRIGRPSAARAVGRANATNPIALLFPCHRIVGADGTLTGYAGGLAIKEALLAHERARVALFA